jgi:hypothetical protein
MLIEELFAILIAIIFIHESLDKLLRIKKNYKFSNNPYVYSQDYDDNSTCFRCAHLDPRNMTTYGEVLNRSIYTERDV